MKKLTSLVQLNLQSRHCTNRSLFEEQAVITSLPITFHNHSSVSFENRKIQNYNFECCFVWVSNLVSHTKERT
jgi:hypothetical protein